MLRELCQRLSGIPHLAGGQRFFFPVFLLFWDNKKGNGISAFAFLPFRKLDSGIASLLPFPRKKNNWKYQAMSRMYLYLVSRQETFGRGLLTVSDTVRYAFFGCPGRHAKTIHGRILCLAVSMVLYGLCEDHIRLEPLAYSTASPHMESMAIGAGGHHMRGSLINDDNRLPPGTVPSGYQVPMITFVIGNDDI